VAYDLCNSHEAVGMALKRANSVEEARAAVARRWWHLSATGNACERSAMPFHATRLSDWNDPRQGKSRLVFPGAPSRARAEAASSDVETGADVGKAGSGIVDPLIRGLVDRLPQPNSA
jgi:hypothetical protein